MAGRWGALPIRRLQSCRRIGFDLRYLSNMSQKRSKRTRRALRSRPLHIVRIEQVDRVSRNILALDFHGAPDSQASQAAIGWLRACLVQANAICKLAAVGLDYGASPNRRSFFELAHRLFWLYTRPKDERSGAVDAMFDEEKRLGNQHLTKLAELGVDELPNLDDLNSVVSEATTDKKIRHEARNFFASVVATPDSAGHYRAWTAETQYTHATVTLAVTYAPYAAGTYGAGTPPVSDKEHELIAISCLQVVATAARILVEDGAPVKLSNSILSAYFDGINAEPR